MHPPQRRRLIEQAVIPSRISPRLFRQFRVHKKPENAQPVIHAHDNHALLRQMCPILPRLRSRARGESSPINPNHHRQLRPRSFRRSPHIQRQAVFTAARVVKLHVTVNFSLHAVRAELRNSPHPTPFRRGHRRLPAQLSHRRRSVGDAQKRANRTVFLAFDLARLGLHLQGGRGPKQSRRRGQHCPRQQRSANHLRFHTFSQA